MAKRQQFVMLHQFAKKTDKTPIRKLAVARKRMRDRLPHWSWTGLDE